MHAEPCAAYTNYTDLHSKLQRNGWVLLRGVVGPSTVARYTATVIAPTRPYDTRAHAIECRRSMGADVLLLRSSPLLKAALDQFNAGAYSTNGDDLRTLHVRHSEHKSVASWRWPLIGWHIDKRILGRSQQLRMIAIVHFTDVQPRGGGTAIVQGSHRFMARVCKHAPRSDFFVDTTNVILLIVAHMVAWVHMHTMHYNVVEICAHAGDVIVMHPWLIHSRTQNHRPTARHTFRLGIHDVL